LNGGVNNTKYESQPNCTHIHLCYLNKGDCTFKHRAFKSTLAFINFSKIYVSKGLAYLSRRAVQSRITEQWTRTKTTNELQQQSFNSTSLEVTFATTNISHLKQAENEVKMSSPFAKTGPYEAFGPTEEDRVFFRQYGIFVGYLSPLKKHPS
jgi:hypothetical protein